MKYMMFVATDTEPDTSNDPEPDIEEWVTDLDSRGTATARRAAATGGRRDDRAGAVR